MPSSSLMSSSTALIRRSESRLSTPARSPGCAQASALTCTARTGFRGRRGAVPTLSLLSVTLPAASRAMSTTDRCGGREKGTEKRPRSSSGASVPFTRSREPASTAPRKVYCSPRLAPSEPFVTLITGARVSTTNAHDARASLNRPPGLDTSTVCSPSLSLRGLNTSLPSRAVARPVTGRPSSSQRVEERSPSSPSTENASVESPLLPTVADAGPAGSSPAGSAAESERRDQAHTGSPTDDEEQRSASSLLAHLARVKALLCDVVAEHEHGPRRGAHLLGSPVVDARTRPDCVAMPVPPRRRQARRHEPAQPPRATTQLRGQEFRARPRRLSPRAGRPTAEARRAALRSAARAPGPWTQGRPSSASGILLGELADSLRAIF